MPSFTILRKRWGRPVKEGELRAAIETVVGPALTRAGLQVQKAEMQQTPVKTGHLRRGWNVVEPAWESSVYRVRVGNAVVYARRVNATSRKNKGFVEAAYRDARGRAESEIRQGIRALAGQLWRGSEK